MENIERVYGVIIAGKEQVYNVIYNSGTERHYYIKRSVPKSVKDFIKSSYVYFVEKDIKLYKPGNDVFNI